MLPDGRRLCHAGGHHHPGAARRHRVRPSAVAPEQTGEERYQARYEDSPEVVRWWRRMATEEAKAMYRQRGSTAEWANAQVRQHGVSQFNVRGLAKVSTVMLLVVVAHNLMRWSTMAP